MPRLSWHINVKFTHRRPQIGPWRVFSVSLALPYTVVRRHVVSRALAHHTGVRSTESYWQLWWKWFKKGL